MRNTDNHRLANIVPNGVGNSDTLVNSSIANLMPISQASFTRQVEKVTTPFLGSSRQLLKHPYHLNPYPVTTYNDFRSLPNRNWSLIASDAVITPCLVTTYKTPSLLIVTTSYSPPVTRYDLTVIGTNGHYRLLGGTFFLDVFYFSTTFGTQFAQKIFIFSPPLVNSDHSTRISTADLSTSATFS